MLLCCRNIMGFAEYVFDLAPPTTDCVGNWSIMSMYGAKTWEIWTAFMSLLVSAVRPFDSAKICPAQFCSCLHCHTATSHGLLSLGIPFSGPLWPSRECQFWDPITPGKTPAWCAKLKTRLNRWPKRQGSHKQRMPDCLSLVQDPVGSQT